MKLIEIIREPCVLCPKTAGIVSESECQKCEHFYGWNLGETKIGCEYGEVDWYEVPDGVNRYTIDDWHVAVEVRVYRVPGTGEESVNESAGSPSSSAQIARTMTSRQ
jgi:hypothetical protein